MPPDGTTGRPSGQPQPHALEGQVNRLAPSMLASFPASMLNQNQSDLEIPNRFRLKPSCSSLRKDGRMVHDYYQFQVKSSGESKGPDDLYTLRATIPAAEAFKPISESTCPLLEK